MKTKLLFLGCLLLFISSCSVEDSNPDNSLTETELIVKKSMEAFYLASKSASFKKFVNGVKSKSEYSELTEEEYQRLLDEFLSQQPQELVDLYYLLISLDLSDNEILEIALRFKEEILGKSEESSKETECWTDIVADGLKPIFQALFCDSSDEDD